MQAGGCVYLNGEFVHPEAARVSAFDHGFLYGDGLFETLRTYGGRPFRLPEHLERLQGGVAELGLTGAPTTAALAGLVEQVLERAALEEAYLRITLTRGEGTRGPDPAHCGPATVMVAALPLRGHPESHYEKGISTRLLWSRPRGAQPPPSVKSTSHQGSILARGALGATGDTEGFFLDAEGHLTEGSFSNLFIVASGRLLTPPAQDCLPGITRAEVIDLARESQLPVAEARLTPAELAEASEAFVTSSLAELLPVTRFLGKPVGGGTPGETYRRLHAAFKKRSRPPSPAPSPAA